MTTIITRMYETVAKANAAAAELADAGFRSAHYQVVSIPTAKKKSERAGNQAALAALKEAGVIPRAAAVYAEHITSGNALVVVKAPLGASYLAKSILDGLSPINVDVRDEVHVEAQDRPVFRSRSSSSTLLPRDAMILSGSLLPAVIRNSTPFSSLFGLPTLSRRGEPRARLVSGSTTPFSSMLGLPLLAKKRAR